MSRLAELGIPIDQTNISDDEITLMLHRKGIGTRKETVKRIRDEKLNGESTFRKVKIANVLASDDPGRKDEVYASLARTALQMRKHLEGEENTHRYTSMHFLNNVADEKDIRHDVLRRCLRAMRTELVFEQLSDHPNVLPIFSQVAEKYLYDYTTGKRPPETIIELDQAWDRKNIHGFYKNFYDIVLQPITMRTWPPYEMEVFSAFYNRRLDEGAGLSVFDKYVLQSHLNDVPEAEFSQIISNLSGVPFNYKVGDHHVNTLLYGKP